MTGDFHVNFDDELWVGFGSTASAFPTSKANLTRIFSLSDASPNYTTATVNAVDYETGRGGEKSLATTTGFSMPCNINIALTDPGYRLILKARDGATVGQLLRFFRVTPVKNGSTDDPEVVRGLAWVTNWQPSNAAAALATASFTLSGYGTPTTEPQGRALATLTITNPGENLTDGTYNNVPLRVADNVGGFGATATVVIAGGEVDDIDITSFGGSGRNPSAGRNYNVGDRLTCDLEDIGEGDGFSVLPVFTVATVAA